MMPSAPDIFAATDATWPPAAFHSIGPFTLRAGQGGGSRVSAASAHPGATPASMAGALAEAEAWMIAQGQRRIFQVREGDAALDSLLLAQGYEIMDPVVAYVARTRDLAATPLKPLRTFRIWPPLAVQVEIWAEGGTGPARLAVMARAKGPKTTLMGRAGDTPSACAFLACAPTACGPLAMLHALQTAPSARRQGLGRDMAIAAGHWAAEQGAAHLVLLVTRANAAANALYAGLGMVRSTFYHYRAKSEL